jgi:ABC-2 type transport system permease protein
VTGPGALRPDHRGDAERGAGGAGRGPIPAGAFAPRPGAASAGRMVLAQALLEMRLMLRNGEQLVLMIVIPALLLALFSAVPVIELGGARRVDFLAPGILALAVLSTAFTGQAIATGYDRRYGVLKRLGATPLPRWGLIVAKTLAVLAIEVLQVALLVAIGRALGWQPHPAVLPAALLLVLGTAAFSGLGLLLAGTLRAEATLALANLLFLLLLLAGDVVVPLSRFPPALAAPLHLLPVTALADGLRTVLQQGGALPGSDVLTLAVWAAAAIAAAGLTFRWE